MVKKTTKKIWRSLFGKRFSWPDVILIVSLVPYIYFVYSGIIFESGFPALYTEFLAGPLTFAVISKLVIQNLMHKAKK
ncbi:MAG: hypothetical protein ACOCV1_01650 [Bacillota bacterium]